MSDEPANKRGTGACRRRRGVDRPRHRRDDPHRLRSRHRGRDRRPSRGRGPARCAVARHDAADPVRQGWPRPATSMPACPPQRGAECGRSYRGRRQRRLRPPRRRAGHESGHRGMPRCRVCRLWRYRTVGIPAGWAPTRRRPPRPGCSRSSAVAGGGERWRQVAPHGGIDPKLPTNPYSLRVPGRRRRPRDRGLRHRHGVGRQGHERPGCGACSSMASTC